MRILIACEFSGRVRDTFADKGHDVWSCDLLPTEKPGLHLQCNVLDILDEGWDMMIAFPPCTHIAVSGARHFHKKRKRQSRALDFFLALLNAPIRMVCCENPVSIASSHIRPPDQIIQPWMFGHEETKQTCLWLENLPPLKPTEVMECRNRNLTPSGQNKLGPSPDRWRVRSRTYKGIARAMADQWGSLPPDFRVGFGIRVHQRRMK